MKFSRLNPQLSNRPSSRYLLIVCLGCGSIAMSDLISTAWGQPGREAKVTVATVVQRDVAAGQEFVGTLVPTRISSVGSAVDGRVIEFPVNEGDRVKKGQPLAKLLTKQLEIQLAGANAELELRRHELDELKNGAREEEKAQAHARLLNAKAARAFNQARLRRVQKLRENSTLTEEDLQAVSMAADQADQAFAEAEAAWKLVEAGPRREEISQAESRLAAQQEVVNGILDQLEKHTIKAPFDGFVVQEFTEVGQWLARGEKVVRVAELDMAGVEVMVLENYIPQLNLGDSARVEIPAIPGRLFEAKIALIVPQGDARSRSFPVKLFMNNELLPSGPLLKSGMFARVTLPVGKSDAATLVPKDAIVLGGPSPMVYVVAPNPQKADQLIAKPLAVELGVSEGGLIQVKGDLQAGEKVVVHGNERLMPMSPVSITREIDTVAKSE
jgi:RND family efflux transporter MFP subunit